MQIFRALRPAASSEACNALLTGLAKCLASPSRLSLELAADVILTLQVIYACTSFLQQLHQCDGLSSLASF